MSGNSQQHCINCPILHMRVDHMLIGLPLQGSSGAGAVLRAFVMPGRHVVAVYVDVGCRRTTANVMAPGTRRPQSG